MTSDRERVRWRLASALRARLMAMSRANAVRGIVSAIECTATVLEEAGRPGGRVWESTGGIFRTEVWGWRVSFRDVSTHWLRRAALGYGPHADEVILVAAYVKGTDPGRVRDLGHSYLIAVNHPSGTSHYTRHRWDWELLSPHEFADRLLPTTGTDHAEYPRQAARTAQAVADAFDGLT